MPSLLKCNVLSTVTFIQNLVPPYMNCLVMQFMITTFGEDPLTSRYSKFDGHPRSPDLILVDVWIWGYVISSVHRSSSCSLAELNDVMHQEISCIYAHMIHALVNGVLIRLKRVIYCGQGHVEHLLLWVCKHFLANRLNSSWHFAIWMLIYPLLTQMFIIFSFSKSSLSYMRISMS